MGSNLSHIFDRRAQLEFVATCAWFNSSTPLGENEGLLVWLHYELVVGTNALFFAIGHNALTFASS